MLNILLLILINLFYLFILRIKMENESTTYYILITSSEEYENKLNTMLTLLFNQIEHYNYNKQIKQPIQIVVCSDNNPKIMQKIMLKKEINNSIHYTFLDVHDEIDKMFVINFIDRLRIVRHISMLNTVVTACNYKYFRSCLTLITSLYTNSNTCIDTIYVFDLGLTNEEQQLLSTLKKVQFVSMNEILDYTMQIRINFTDFFVPNQFAWKFWFIKYIFEHHYKIENVFWIDSGKVTFGNIGTYT